ncbi:Cyclin-dependent kinase G-2 [Acorus gramineus]|uniref:[RNA-polymerase]-subunit kinase n=1 Tax=Acorus gramineus TaxID=55184 RepID=A0AAV9B672_ACOGR|nr:Cyclin-dependent kinase G-2 [Acorus gramineus]
MGDSRVRVSEGHVKEREGVNGSRCRRSHGRSSSELDREPGELSSGSDGPESRDGRVDVDDRGGKKLKFSPIVWDLDNKGSDARKPAGAALPPPPPLPQGFLPRSEPAEAGIRSTGSATSVLDYPASQNGLSRSDDMEPGELDEEDHVPTRNIAASRWADDSDGGDSDEYEDAARLSSSVDSEVEEEPAGMPEPLKPPRRGINMLQGCRSVFEFEKLNRIDEGTYGVVMEYMEHDLKGLMETLRQPFSQSEVKCLMLQLLEGVKCLHDNWVLHRDLKTSNLLFNNQGELKICDFGMARQYGSPLKPYTSLVVTLWYRAPELLLVPKEHLTAEYSTAVDMWSLGCIMAEMLAKEPLFSGKTEIDQLDKIFKMLGTPTEKIWPGLAKLPHPRIYTKQPYNKLREKFPPTSFCGGPTLSEAGFDLLNRLLTYDPEKRITAEAALQHEWFREVPLPKSKDFMPTFPAQHAQDRRLRRVLKSPDPLKEQQKKEMQQRELGSAGLFGAP